MTSSPPSTHLSLQSPLHEDSSLEPRAFRAARWPDQSIPNSLYYPPSSSTLTLTPPQQQQQQQNQHTFNRLPRSTTAPVASILRRRAPLAQLSSPLPSTSTTTTIIHNHCRNQHYATSTINTTENMINIIPSTNTNNTSTSATLLPSVPLSPSTFPSPILINPNLSSTNPISFRTSSSQNQNNTNSNRLVGQFTITNQHHFNLYPYQHDDRTTASSSGSPDLNHHNHSTNLPPPINLSQTISLSLSQSSTSSFVPPSPLPLSNDLINRPPVQLSPGLSPSLREALPQPKPLRPPPPITTATTTTNTATTIHSDLSAASTRAEQEPLAIKDLRQVTAPLSLMDPWTYTSQIQQQQQQNERQDFRRRFRKSISSTSLLTDRMSEAVRRDRWSLISERRLSRNNNFRFVDKRHVVRRLFRRSERHDPTTNSRNSRVIPDRFHDISDDDHIQMDHDDDNQDHIISVEDDDSTENSVLSELTRESPQSDQQDDIAAPLPNIIEDIQNQNIDDIGNEHEENNGFRARALSESQAQPRISFAVGKEKVLSAWEKFWRKRKRARQEREERRHERFMPSGRDQPQRPEQRSGKLYRFRTWTNGFAGDPRW